MLLSNRLRGPLTGCLAFTALALMFTRDSEAGRRRGRRCCGTVINNCAPLTCAAPCAAGCAAPGAIAPAPSGAAEPYSPEAAPPPADAPAPTEPSPAPETTSAPSSESEEGWVSLTNGKDFDGWKKVEHPDTWTFEDGAFVAKGERSHLFYVGDDKPFKNFELKVDVKAKNNSNGGIYIHTKPQDEGWPKYGHEVQVNNSYTHDPKKSGSLYGIVDVTEQHIPDDEWWTEYVKVEGKHITIKLNDKVVVDYEEPAEQPAFSDQFERRLSSEGGTFALQAHDPNSTVYYKNIRVKRLP